MRMVEKFRSPGNAPSSLRREQKVAHVCQSRLTSFSPLESTMYLMITLIYLSPSQTHRRSTADISRREPLTPCNLSKSVTDDLL